MIEIVNPLCKLILFKCNRGRFANFKLKGVFQTKGVISCIFNAFGETLSGPDAVERRTNNTGYQHNFLLNTKIITNKQNERIGQSLCQRLSYITFHSIIVKAQLKVFVKVLIKHGFTQYKDLKCST